jgi:hypothetical protein
MTEAEAKQKLCPFTFSGRDGGKCIASKCMLWQWKKWDGIPAHHSEVKNGFCSLAGER